MDAACNHKVAILLDVTSWQDAHEIHKVHKTLLHKPSVAGARPPLSHSALRRSQSLQGDHGTAAGAESIGNVHHIMP